MIHAYAFNKYLGHLETIICSNALFVFGLFFFNQLKRSIVTHCAIIAHNGRAISQQASLILLYAIKEREKNPHLFGLLYNCTLVFHISLHLLNFHDNRLNVRIIPKNSNKNYIHKITDSFVSLNPSKICYGPKRY